jgi:hypothetical protein
MSASPFKFLDSYTRADIGDFFGRDKETDELFRQCFLSPILVVYGGSGTGKTSLVQCGLASRFQDSDWLPVPVRRSGDMIASLRDAINAATLTASSSTDLGELAANLYLDHFKPVYFLFDQFEELFIFGGHAESEVFFATMRALLEKERNAHAIFVVREEYLAELTRYERIIPGLIENRYRVERLTQRHAMEVVEKLCGAHNIPRAEGFSAALVGRLDPEGQGIELSYLQVFLDRCWRTRQGDELFSPALLERIGHVDDMLGAFLDEQVADTPEPQRSESLLKTFVSDQGTKRQLTSTEAHDWVQTIGTAMELAEVERLLQVFVAKRLLKDRDERGRYELLHDALARQIFQRITRAEQELIEVRQFVQQAHGQFLKRRVKLTANDLTYLRPYRNQLHLKGEMKEFVEGAFGEEERKTRQLKRARKWRMILFIIGGAFMVAAVVQKTRELSEEEDRRWSLELAEESRGLLNSDPLKSLAYARQAFLTDSNETTIKALTAAYDLGYNEVARYDGNFITWHPSMKFYAIGNERQGMFQSSTLQLFDDALRLTATLDSVILDNNCKFVSDSLFACARADHRLMVINGIGRQVQSFHYNRTGSVSEERWMNDSTGYFTLHTDDLLHVLDSRGHEITTLDLADTVFRAADHNSPTELHLWNDEWAFLLGLKDVTFYRFDNQGHFVQRQILTIDNPTGIDPMRSVTVERPVRYLHTSEGIRLYDEEGFFQPVLQDTAFILRTLLSVPGTARDVQLVWFDGVQKPVFGFNDPEGHGRARYINDSDKVLDWSSSQFVKPIKPGEENELVAQHAPMTGMTRSPSFLITHAEDWFQSYLTRFSDGLAYVSGTVLLSDARTIREAPSSPVVYFERASCYSRSEDLPTRSRSMFMGSTGSRGMKSIGADLLALNQTMGSGVSRWLILDTLLNVIAALPDPVDAEITSIRVKDTLSGASMDQVVLSTPTTISRIRLDRRQIRGLPEKPVTRTVRRNVLATTGWWNESLDSMSFFLRDGAVYCKSRTRTSASIFAMLGDSFSLKNTVSINQGPSPECVVGIGEQALFQYRPGRAIVVIDEHRAWTAELPEAHSPMGAACVAPDGSILYQTNNSGFALWDTSSTVNMPAGFSLKELFYVSQKRVDTLINVKKTAVSVEFQRLQQHYHSHRGGTANGKCLLSDWQEAHTEFSFVGCLNPMDSVSYSLNGRNQTHTLGDFRTEVRQLQMMSVDVGGAMARLGRDSVWDPRVDTMTVRDSRFTEIAPVASHSLLLRRSEDSEDGFALVVGNCVSAEHTGYAAPCGSGMILTDHRLGQYFERYPATPNAILHMLDVEKVYGTTLSTLGPRPVSANYSAGYAMGRFLSNNAGAIGIVVLALMAYLIRRRVRRWREAKATT